MCLIDIKNIFHPYCLKILMSDTYYPCHIFTPLLFSMHVVSLIHYAQSRLLLDLLYYASRPNTNLSQLFLSAFTSLSADCTGYSFYHCPQSGIQDGLALNEYRPSLYHGDLALFPDQPLRAVVPAPILMHTPQTALPHETLHISLLPDIRAQDAKQEMPRTSCLHTILILRLFYDFFPATRS